MPRKHGKPGASSTRKVKHGPNKGDIVQFTNNSASAELPGKPVARRLVKDKGARNRSKLPRGPAVKFGGHT